MKIQDAIKEVVKSNQGRFFTVTFIKKDGSVRKINGRLGVKKYLKGGKNTVANYDKYLTMYALKAGYRNIDCGKIVSIKMQHKEIVIK
jgi:hypothetical protein